MAETRPISDLAEALGVTPVTANGPVGGHSATLVVHVSGEPTGGTFRLARADEEGDPTEELTDPIPYNANAATVAAALEGLSNIGAGNIEADEFSELNTLAAPVYRVALRFTGDLANQERPAAIAGDFDGADLTGGSSPFVSASYVDDGSAPGDLVRAEALELDMVATSYHFPGLYVDNGEGLQPLPGLTRRDPLDGYGAVRVVLNRGRAEMGVNSTVGYERAVVKTQSDGVVELRAKDVVGATKALVQLDPTNRFDDPMPEPTFKAEVYASNGTPTGVEVQPGLIVFKGLPTSNPNVAGALWNDSGTLKISAG